MDFTTKIDIGKLVGKSNWMTWKYKISIMLEGTENAMAAVQGKLVPPTPVQDSEGDAAVSAYNAALARYKKTETGALLMITTNLSEETLMKVMRYRTAHEVWQELHRLFDGNTGDRAYTLCMEFFSAKHDKADDIATHMSKLKNLWNDLKAEVSKVDETAKLPEMFLICKILDTLDDRFFNFKSSWLMLKQSEKTVDSLTSNLCTFERNIDSQESTRVEALVTAPSDQRKDKDEKLICNYCHLKGHKVRKCKKWLRDGRPSKSIQGTSETHSKSKQVQQISLMVNACSNGPGQTQDRENWFVDNGATTHIAVRRDFFNEFHEFDIDHTVTTADGTIIPALGKGSVEVETKVGGKREKIMLRDVWLVPSLTKNLFSPLAAHDRMQASVFTSKTTECKFDVDGTTRAVGKRLAFGGLYQLQMNTVMPVKRTIEVNVINGSNMLQLYHERLAHQNKNHVIRVVKRELGIQLTPDKVNCEGCIYGKAHRKPFGTRERASKCGELIHTDVCGPFADSITKYKYYVLFKDDYSSYRFVYFLRQKSEVKDKLILMLQEAKNAGHEIKTILSDNGGEFDNAAVRKILCDQGVQHRLTMPYTPEQNGCSERENRTLVEAARSMMHARGEMPQVLWAELINTAAYVLNRTGPTRVDTKSPYELWHGKKPKISHLRVIGSECYAHIPKQNRKKMSKKAVKGKLIGYEGDDGYRIWNGRETLRSRDISFQTDVEFKISTSEPLQSGGAESGVRNIPETEPNLENYELALEGDRVAIDQVHEEDERTDEDPEVPNEVFLEPSETELEIAEPTGCSTEPEPRYNLRDRTTIARPRKFDDFVCGVCSVVNDSFPETYKDAIAQKDGEEWRKAMENEINSLKELNVWTPCSLPKGRKALPCKWVLRIKRNPDGSIDKYKARLVVKGFRQRKGIDYDQTFSPVARMATIRALLSVSAQEKLHLIQFDVCTAFLNGKLQEEIYVQQPEGYADGSSNVLKLNRSLYGLKQAPRCWNSCFEQILLDMDFKQSEADCCLYTKRVNDKKILITLYVDDGLVAASDEELANSFLADLKTKLKITTKPASYYLGLEIVREADGSIFIKQEAYAKRVLERFGMANCNPIGTPIESTQSVKVDAVEAHFPYREAVGSLAYLMTGTRPDIAYAVGVASRKLESPTREDWLLVKRIMRYVKGTCSYGIKYKAHQKSTLLESFSDADHGGCHLSGRSTTGLICRYSGGTVSWLSQRQASVAISTTEAEIVAASEGAREIVWLSRVYKDLTDLKEVPVLHVDNEAAIRLAHNPEFHKRTKHIRIRHFFVREVVEEGGLVVKKVSSDEQLADFLTKAVPKPKQARTCVQLGICKGNT
ncbi:hypothetical protein O0L34_g13315 [Tuta absoluta]|nr:hypothetical protein O0L34_g13315 [Tuta absoluta]